MDKILYLPGRLIAVGMQKKPEYSTTHAAVILGVDRRTINKWCVARTVRFRRIGKLKKISAEELERHLQMGAWG